MFAHAGACHVAMPAHVAGALPRVTITTAAPVASDQATVRKPFWPEMDLAVAFVDPGPLDGRCTAGLSDLAQSPRSRVAAEALLLRVTQLGEEERLPMRVLDRGYRSIAAELLRPEDAVGQGTSGALAFVGATPIGMALTSDDPTRLRLLPAPEIAINLGRFLDEQGVAFRSGSEAGAPPAPEVQVTGLAVAGVSSSAPPVLPQLAADNLLGAGLYVARPDAPVEITLRLAGDRPHGVGRVRLTAPGGAYAVPRDVALLLDAGETGERFRFWTQGRMTPDGRFDTGPLAPRNARWVRIVLRDAWSAGEVALDRVTVE
jgi:hypothetical protein